MEKGIAPLGGVAVNRLGDVEVKLLSRRNADKEAVALDRIENGLGVLGDDGGGALEGGVAGRVLVGLRAGELVGAGAFQSGDASRRNVAAKIFNSANLSLLMIVPRSPALPSVSPQDWPSGATS